MNYFWDIPHCLTSFLVLDGYESETFGEDYYQYIDQHDFFMELHGIDHQDEDADRDMSNVTAFVSVTKKSYEDYLKNKNARKFNPLTDTPELFMELNKLDYTDKTLMKFIENYGIPSDINYEDEQPVFEAKFNSTNRVISSMDVLAFYKYQLMPFKKTVALWDAIQHMDNEYLERAVHEFYKEAYDLQCSERRDYLREFVEENKLEISTVSPISIEVLNQWIMSFENDPRIDWSMFEPPELWNEWVSVEDETLRNKALKHLIVMLKQQKSENIGPELVNGQIIPAMRFSNLVEVAFWQLSRAVLGNIKFGHCTYCKAPFEPKHGHQKFCAPLPGRKRSTCEGNYNKQIKRIRRKEKETKNNPVE